MKCLHKCLPKIQRGCFIRGIQLFLSIYMINYCLFIGSWQKDKQHGFVEKSMEPIALFHDARSFIDSVANGIGVAQLYDKAVKDLLENRSLVEILPEYSMMEFPVNAIIPSGRLMPKKTRVFAHPRVLP